MAHVGPATRETPRGLRIPQIPQPRVGEELVPSPHCPKHYARNHKIYYTDALSRARANEVFITHQGWRKPKSHAKELDLQPAPGAGVWLHLQHRSGSRPSAEQLTENPSH